MSGSGRHALILGGHGKVSQHLTRLLIAKSWTVTSVIRAREQVPAVEKLGAGAGRLKVLVRSLEDVREQAHAQAVLDEVEPDTVIWSAGAGGKGNPERTFTVDRDAAIHFIRASAATPAVKKFILVSYLASRRSRPSWWPDEEWRAALEVNGKLSNYFEAKVAADEVLWEESRRRGERGGGGDDDFAGVSLRPGTLTDEPVAGVELGRTAGSRGTSSRRGVAEVAALIAGRDGFPTSWVDHLDGREDPAAAVERVARDGVDAAEGEAFYVPRGTAR